MSCFRFIFSETLSNGSRVFVVDGSGYVPGHAVYVFDSEDRLIYHEVAAGHARGVLVPVRGEQVFWIAARNTIWRYDLGVEP